YCFYLQLLLVAIVAARFGGSTRRTTLALACDESLTATATHQDNRYNSYYSSNSNNNDNSNNDVDDDDDDGIADSKDNNVDDDDNNDNYNYNKALAKWQLPQQKLYGNPQSIQQQQQLQQQQRLQQFVDDPEAARNDFLLQLPDLNTAMWQGVGLFATAQDTSNSNNNNNNDYDNNVWQAASETERERDGEHLPRNSRSSHKPRHTAGTQTGTGADAGGQLETDADGIDFEGEEDFAVAKVDADELSDQLPYGIQNVRKRRVRSVIQPPPPVSSSSPEGVSQLAVTYQSLCPTKRVTVKLDNGEYRPNHYVEVTCANNYAPLPPRLHNYDNYNYRSNELPLLRALLNERAGEKREICSATGFACIQLNRTIHLIRLNEGSGCWESETRTVPSGCECMWPKHSYGDIASYHQAQKRVSNTLTNLRARGNANAVIDYTPGVGYRQLTLRSRGPKTGGGGGGGSGGIRSRRAD
ncbi:hypothetical protein KR215_001722, partial [Drosophila sulfurigaster]